MSTSGPDDSLGSEVGERVERLVESAERDARTIERQADDEAGRVLDRARAEARAIRAAAERRAQELAADRVTRILLVHRELSEGGETIAALAEDPQDVTARISALLEALARRADLLAREIGLVPAEPAAAEEELAEPEPEQEMAAMTVGVTSEPLREARLAALRSAVAGASRTELEAELCETLAADDAAAVLDDVFGRPRSPFPKWSAAKKRVG